jgi:hypothetical protein
MPLSVAHRYVDDKARMEERCRAKVGFLVYPPVEPNESFHLKYQGDGRFQFIYLVSTPGGEWYPVFSLAIQLPLGSIGMIKEEVAFKMKTPLVSDKGFNSKVSTQTASAVRLPPD